MFGIKDMTGCVLSPNDAFLMIRGMKTLQIRMDKHCANAMAVAKFLESHSAVEKVYYPGLESFEGHELAKKQMSQFKVRNFLTHAIIPLAISTSATYITCCFFERLIPNSLIFFIFYVLICIATTSIVFWLLSLNRGERYIIKQLLKSKLHRL